MERCKDCAIKKENICKENQQGIGKCKKFRIIGNICRFCRWRGCRFSNNSRKRCYEFEWD